VTLLERVAVNLSEHEIPHALIGAAALAVHGVSRSTLDQDLLVQDRRVLDSRFWSALGGGAIIDVRIGDAEDPLAGVVRINEGAERGVDVVVGRHRWQDDIIRRAVAIGGHHPPVVQRADLILLKLYAGGSQDRWDIEQLLAVDSSTGTVATVDGRVESLPARCRDMWSTLRQRS
jgi:hypothetical protein